MFLRSISIRGFKSFANKSVIRLEPGITTIVGPNGSGKSNIVDAVLWVLGEQKPKTLRGATMQDIIFSGSNVKQSLGVAEVTLRLDNSDGSIPIEYNEVTITRRAYRSGENEYLLNNSACRLLDIQEMLSDSGLGREMYSVISQGKLDKILNCKPEERRRLIEGTAGVLKHKQRKKRALRKLISTDKNITRLSDILSELNSQIEPLRKQADKAVVYNKLKKELAAYEVSLCVNKLRYYQESWDKLKVKALNIENDIITIKDELELKKKSISVYESESEALLSTLGKIGDNRRKFENISEQIKSGALLLQEKKRNLNERLNEMRRSLAGLDKKEEKVLADIERNEADMAESDERLAALNKKIEEVNIEADAIKREVQGIAENYDDCYARLQSRMSRIKKEREILSKEESVISAGGQQVSFLTEQQDKVGERLESMIRESALAEAELKRLKDEWSSLSKKIAKRQIKIDNLVDIVEARQKELDGLIVKKDSLSAKIIVLKGIANDLREPTETKDRLLNDKSNFSEILGPMFELIKVKPKYETAVETALSRDIYSLVAPDITWARKVFDSFYDDNDDFISLVLADFSNVEVDVSLDIDWATPAMSVVECPQKAYSALSALLGRVYIVESLSSLLDNIDKSYPGCSFVTLDGDLLTERGVIRHGVFSQKKLGLISCLRETTDLEEEEIAVKRGIVKVGQALEDGRFNLKNEQNYVLKLSTGAQEIEAEISELEIGCRHYANEQKNLLLEKKDLEKQINGRVTSIKKQNNDTKEQSLNIDKDESAIKGLEEELKSFKFKLDQSRAREREAITRLSAFQVELASLTERGLHLKQKSASLAHEAEANGKTRSLNLQAKIKLENILRHLLPMDQFYEEMLSSAHSRLERIRDVAQRAATNSATLKEQLNLAQDDIELLREKLGSRQEKKNDIKIKQARTEMKVRESTDYLVNELNIPLKIALKDEDGEDNIDELKIRVKKIKSELNNLGMVNPGALDEYKRLNERSRFLDSQINDLKASRSALKKVIIAIEDKINEKFLVTLAKVNENFSKVFRRLFPGGRVRLMLTEADDEGEAGVEIEAQPRGKTLQSINLLSGGEKSLVGLALLFAFFYTRPSPFYILDEVEAALDDINIQRFIGLIEQLKANAQFLIITHQRRTMEIADSLYGVSMQADGVSKLVSQKLEKGENVTKTEPKTTRAVEIGTN